MFGHDLLVFVITGRADSTAARAPVATVNAAVSICIDALTYPVARAFALLGRGASSVELHQLRQPLRSALTLI
jgi:hypothetical protein